MDSLFWSRVDKNGPVPSDNPSLGACWVWMGYRMAHGHGQVRRVVNGRSRGFLAHRYSYAEEYGEIPEGYEIDHQCRNSPCVRPSHLKAVTHRQNMENLGLDRRNVSGYRGVSWHPQVGKWAVYVNDNGKSRYGGLFEDVHQAGARARELRDEMYTNNVEPEENDE